MLKKKLLSLIILLFCLIGILPIQANDIAAQQTLTTFVTNKYLNSNFITEIAPVNNEPKPQENTSFIKELNKQFDSQKQILTERETQEAAFSIISSSFFNQNTIIDESIINKLELIGGGENAKQHLFGILFDTKLHTTLGKAYTTLHFCNPITNINVLKNRQETINTLAHQPANLKRLNTIFSSIKNCEAQSLTYWHSKPVLSEQLMKAYYFNMEVLKPFNTNSIALELTNRTLQTLITTINFSYFPLIISYNIKQIANAQGVSFATIANMAAKEAKSWLENPNIAIKEKAFAGASISFILSLQTLMAYQGFKGIKFWTEGTYHLQSILTATSQHINQLKNLSSFVNKNKQLIKLLPSLQVLADFNNSSKHSAELNKLLDMLATNTFKGNPSFWSISGRILAAHKLMAQVKDELAPVLAVAGQLEMYVGIAQLYNEQQGKNATYCMAHFIENNTPLIEAQNFWNPFINPNTVVVNDILFNSKYPNSVLTGPNTGGKSTIIKGVMLNILMAQTFGIAAAESFTLTPFSKLNCFMNIADDIATGASLFKSEVMRAKELSTMISNLKKDEFSFVIIDEVFTGTSPVEGEMAALRFAQHLTKFRNSIAVIATHYPKMTTLEDLTEGKFYNHHVEILRNEDGSLNRTFKLKNGPTFVNVALDILEEEGLII